MSTFPTTEILQPAELHVDASERELPAAVPAPSRGRAWLIFGLTLTIAVAIAALVALATPVPGPVRAIEGLTVMILVGGVALALLARVDAALTRRRR